MSASHFTRVMEGVCHLVGLADPEVLIKGGKLRIGEYLISFVFDESFDPEKMFIYVDMGRPESDSEDTYKRLMKTNFELLAGLRGVLSVHPESDHIFYAIFQELDEETTGQYVLDMLSGFIENLGLEAAAMPAAPSSTNHTTNRTTAASGRTTAAHLLAKSAQLPPRT